MIVQREQASVAKTAPKAQVPPPAQAGAGAALKSQLRGQDMDVQQKMLAPASDAGAVHEAAAAGVKGGGSAMPHLGTIQKAFGKHDVGGAKAHVGGEAKAATQAMGASAYASGNDVAFGESPDLHTAAHEAAHLVQQKSGVSLASGVGQSGDHYEQHADQVADAVVAGKSAEGLLDKKSSGGAAAGVQKKAVVQKDDKKAATPPAPLPPAEQSTTSAPPISYTVPPVVDVAKIDDPVARNQAINQSYHSFDTAMTSYLGEPLVANWMTFGQHASREAGSQIRNLQAAKTLLSDISAHLADFQGVTLSASTPWGFIDAVKGAWRMGKRAYSDIKMVLGLLGEEGLVKQSVLLWLDKAGITLTELRTMESRFGAMADLDISDIGISTAREAYNLVADVLNLGIRMASGIPGLITAMDKIYANMVKGNKEIYENIAPAYSAFLQAGLSGNGVVGSMAFGGDSRGFVGAAMKLYSEVREKANAIATMDAADGKRGPLVSQRQQTAHKANLLIGYQEQLVILQPIFDTMKSELAAMAGTMNLHDPNGTHPLAANWQDFYTRMGLDPAKTPPLDQINASNLGELVKASDPRYQGTIGQYFESGLTNKKVHEAPPSIKKHGT